MVHIHMSVETYQLQYQETDVQCDANTPVKSGDFGLGRDFNL